MADIIDKFKATETQYNELKEKHRRGELTAQEVKGELKRLMLQDEDGKYWMLGGKSGKWYVHDGTQWQEGDPYEQFKPIELELEEGFSDIPGAAGEQEQGPVISASGEYDISMEAGESASEPVVSLEADESASASASVVSLEEEAAQSEEQSFTVLEDEKESEDAYAYKDMEVDSHSYDVSYSEGDAGSHKEAEAAGVRDQEVDTGDYYQLQEEEPLIGETADTMYKETEMNVEIELEDGSAEEAAAEAKIGEDVYEREIGAESVYAEDTGTGMDAGAAVDVDAGTGAAAGVDTGAGAVPAPAVIDTVEKKELLEKEYIKCRICESRIPPYALYCTFCGANQKEVDKKSVVKPLKKGIENELLIKYIKIISLLFFLGGLGLIAGVILGACFGIFGSFMSGLADQLPMMLSETRGGVAGGLIFAAIGGIGGFILSAVLAVVLGGIYNLVSHIFGGIRFKVKQ
jgi:hypothetical protein